MSFINISLNNFNGPLDLLLYLIGKAQIDIKDIFISKITEQYVQTVYINENENMDTIGDFLAMAARLIEIKSKALLPKDDLEEDTEEEKRLLIIQLEEYKRFKLVCEQLNKYENDSLQQYTKLTEEIILPPQEYVLIDHSIKSLCSAIFKLIERRLIYNQKTIHSKNIKQLSKETITIKQGIVQILKNIKSGTFLLSDIDGYKTNKEHAVTFFIAVLELLKLGRVKTKQNGIFNSIKIQRNEKING